MQLAKNAVPKVLTLDPSMYPGGIAIWGALDPIYNTSDAAVESGVHVHARMQVGGTKSIDETFDEVEIPLMSLSGREESFRIQGTDAASYNISTILKRQLVYLPCPACKHIHSDTDSFAVFYHQDHQCEQCGVSFRSDTPCISNPVMLLKHLCKDEAQERQIIDPVQRNLPTKQSKWYGGMQIWGSNPAILWTSTKLEEGGAHFHGFHHRGTDIPSADETFGTVHIDGLALDPEQVRLLMAQQALPYLAPSLTALDCPYCGQEHFDRQEHAVVPHMAHYCSGCHTWFPTPLPCVSNPMLRIIATLKKNYEQLSWPKEAL